MEHILRINGKNVKSGDEVIYLLEQGSKVSRVPARIVNVTQKRVTIEIPLGVGIHHRCSVMQHKIEGFEIPVAALREDAGFSELELAAYRIKDGFQGTPGYDKADVIDEIKKLLDRMELFTLQTVQQWIREQCKDDYNEPEAFAALYEVRERLEKTIKKLTT